MIKNITRIIKAPKLIAMAIALGLIVSISSSGIVKAGTSQNFFDVAKPTEQKVCYAQYGGAGWQALGFSNLDHCLRYVTTQAPDSKAACNHGYWYVFGFNSWDQCTSWVVAHGGSGYAGDPNEWF